MAIQAIRGDTWQYMAMYGLYMAIHANTWLYMIVHGNTWLNIAIDDNT